MPQSVMIFDKDGNVVDKLKVQLEGSGVMIPTDVQSRLQQTVQAHNATSIGATSYLSSEWIDTQGFSEVGITLLNDATTSSNCEALWSHNASTRHGTETALSTGTGRDRVTSISTKARYLKLNIYNGDAVAHTFSSWVYLKV
jgi:hypothetical protein